MSTLGYVIKGRLWSPAQINTSFANKTVIVTGSNSGIGFEAALKFVELGASTLIIAVRSTVKGEEAKARIEESTGRRGVVQVWELDMDNFTSIDAFARRVDTSLPKLDIVVLNAGVVSRRYEASSEGWEKMLQINTISTALLSILLLPKLRSSSTASEPAHMEIVASIAYQDAKLSQAELGDQLHGCNKPEGFGNAMAQYAISKLFIMWIARELAERCIRPDGTVSVIINDVCPGGCRSNVTRDFKTPFLKFMIMMVDYIINKSAEQGARTVVGATALGVESHGKFWTCDKLES